MPRLLLLIGLPGSGKTTLGQSLLAQDTRRVCIATDTIRAQLFGDAAHQGPWPQIAAEMQRQLARSHQHAQQGQITDTLLDATHAVRRHRREAIAQVRAIGFAPIIGLWLDVPLATCLARNRQRERQVPEPVIRRMHRCLTGAPPSLDEDLDALIVIRGAGQSLLEVASTPEIQWPMTQ